MWTDVTEMARLHREGAHTRVMGTVGGRHQTLGLPFVSSKLKNQLEIQGSGEMKTEPQGHPSPMADAPGAPSAAPTPTAELRAARVHKPAFPASPRGALLSQCPCPSGSHTQQGHSPSSQTGHSPFSSLIRAAASGHHFLVARFNSLRVCLMVNCLRRLG